MATWRLTRRKIYQDIVEVEVGDEASKEDIIDMVDRGSFTLIQDDSFQYADDPEEWEFLRVPTEEERREEEERIARIRERQAAMRALDAEARANRRRNMTIEEAAAQAIADIPVADLFAPAINRVVDARRAAPAVDDTMEDVRFEE